MKIASITPPQLRLAFTSCCFKRIAEVQFAATDVRARGFQCGAGAGR
jgi:pyruvate dehydrogenase complex dehydrogenase (E1) component